MVNIGVLSNARSPIYRFLSSYLTAMRRFDITLTSLTSKSDFKVIDLFIFEKTMPGIADLMKDCGNATVMLDADNTDIIRSLSSMELCVITCGLAQNATVTASSVEDKKITYCLQRSIFDMGGNEILPQEFGIHFKNKLTSLSEYLLGTTALLLCGESGEELQDFMF